MKKEYQRPEARLLPLLLQGCLALSTDDDEEWGWQGTRKKGEIAGWKQPGKKLWDEM
ncbi:MAG: hypothetical protein IJ586_06360 [Alloprevotella sp.]|nr:hypothetical protein [Alloprevotella sp.]